MSTPKKEIIKAIYIKIANDSLEFITISSKEELQSKKDKIKLVYPSNEIVVKTFASIECEHQPKFYKFICEIIDGDFIGRAIPCSSITSSFCIRHISDTNQVSITICGDNEDDAFHKAHNVYKNLYTLQYLK